MVLLPAMKLLVNKKVREAKCRRKVATTSPKDEPKFLMVRGSDLDWEEALEDLRVTSCLGMSQDYIKLLGQRVLRDGVLDGDEMLGLGNAATPLGLKAMEELQELNPKKDTATNAMVMFLAINTSSVQVIIPATVVALMGAAASQIFITTILATLASTITAILMVRLLEKMKRFSVENAS